MTRKVLSRPFHVLFIVCGILLMCGIASATTTRTSSGSLSAHLTKTSFTSSRSSSVKLIYKFSKPSKSFSYLLSFKKGSKWRSVKSVKKTGTFTGSKSTTAKKLFAGKVVKVGSYRLKLSCDTGSKTLGFKVTKSSGGDGSGSDGGTTPEGAAPVNTALPWIAGAPIVGQDLAALPGSWTGNFGSFAYQWRRCDSSGFGCYDVYDGAKWNNYTLASLDAGHTFRVVITATNGYGPTSATSAQTAVVKYPSPASTALPTISGTAT